MTHVKILFKWMFVFCLIVVGTMVFQSGMDLDVDVQWAGTWLTGETPAMEDPVDIADHPDVDDADQRAEVDFGSQMTESHT